MGGNYPRLESAEFEGRSANRIGGNFGGAPRTLLYVGDPDALREIVDAIRRGLGIVKETRDGVYPRLASVEFEDWGASRIGGNFDDAPRTLPYGGDRDALYETVDPIRRGLGIVEETLKRRRQI